MSRINKVMQMPSSSKYSSQGHYELFMDIISYFNNYKFIIRKKLTNNTK